MGPGTPCRRGVHTLSELGLSWPDCTCGTCASSAEGGQTCCCSQTSLGTERGCVVCCWRVRDVCLCLGNKQCININHQCSAMNMQRSPVPIVQAVYKQHTRLSACPARSPFFAQSRATQINAHPQAREMRPPHVTANA